MTREETDFRERKVLSGGGEEIFPLKVMGRGKGWLLARHITRREYSVGPLHIPRGTESLGVFVEGASWVLYSWFKGPSPRGVYLNAAGDVRIGEREVVWVDLLLDILYLPGGGRYLLDYDEAVDSLGVAGAEELLRNLQEIEVDALNTAINILKKNDVHPLWWPSGRYPGSSGESSGEY